MKRLYKTWKLPDVIDNNLLTIFIKFSVSYVLNIMDKLVVNTELLIII